MDRPGITGGGVVELVERRDRYAERRECQHPAGRSHQQVRSAGGTDHDSIAGRGPDRVTGVDRADGLVARRLQSDGEGDCAARQRVPGQSRGLCIGTADGQRIIVIGIRVAVAIERSDSNGRSAARRDWCAGHYA